MNPGTTVILFDHLTTEQRFAVWEALETLDVDFVTLVTAGTPQRFTDSEIGAAEFRTAQAACVYAGLVTAQDLDNAGLLTGSL